MNDPDTVPASQLITQETGVTHYRAEVAGGNTLTVEAFNGSGMRIIRIIWSGVQIPEGSISGQQYAEAMQSSEEASGAASITIEKPTVGVVSPAGGPGPAMDPGAGTPVTAPPGPPAGASVWSFALTQGGVNAAEIASNPLVIEMNMCLQDLQRQILASRPVSALSPEEDEVTFRRSDRQRRVMNVICFVARRGANFWPIGTLIFGPTVVGCLVWDLTEPDRPPIPMYEAP